MTKSELQDVRCIIRRALDEDIGEGDITTVSTVSRTTILKGRFVAKAPGIIAGLEVVHEIFKMLDTKIDFRPQVNDGSRVMQGQLLAKIRGKGRALLAGERVSLNFLQRMSGIATMTRAFVEAIEGTSAVILDTRKTAPGIRLLDKWAVRCGGGENHRFGLYDMVLIKDNHIAAAGGITQAVTQVWANEKKNRLVEVEVKDLKELCEALSLKVDRILLDNMDVETMRDAVRFTAGRVPLEASGNVTLDNVVDIAETGVDMISVGALTHSVRALDISFLIDAK